jgi:hypothetical protein
MVCGTATAGFADACRENVIQSQLETQFGAAVCRERGGSAMMEELIARERGGEFAPPRPEPNKFLIQLRRRQASWRLL